MFSFFALLSSDGAARRWPGWLLPTAVFTGFALFFLTLYRDRLLPAREVRVGAVLATADADRDGGSPDLMFPGAFSLLFQASGWVEPDPHAVKASALVDGTSTTERRDGYARVREGVRPGERVVLSPSGLRDGQRVTPLPLQP